jgi:general L-amino acid transport system permease protein
MLLAVVGGWFFVGIGPTPDTIVIEQDGAAVVMPVEQAQAEGLLLTEDLQRISNQPLLFFLPEQNRFGRFDVGAEITPEFTALLLALVIYTSSFIAEIVRAGIQAVPHGQVEAARALGLSQAQVLSQIVLPQALRVIIPPLGNQYLNLSKNSSLGIGIGYAEMFMTSYTVMNQSGQTVTTFAILMLFYLVISLSISLVMNIVNRRFQLVTR